MRWESEGDHRSGNGKDPIGLFHFSYSTLPGRRESLDRRCTGRPQPNIPVVWKFWRYNKNLNWSHETPCGQRKRVGFVLLLGCFTSALVLVWWQVTLCKIQENPFCPFSRPVTAPLFYYQLLLSQVEPSDASPHRSGSGFPCDLAIIQESLLSA